MKRGQHKTRKILTITKNTHPNSQPELLPLNLSLGVGWSWSWKKREYSKRHRQKRRKEKRVAKTRKGEEKRREEKGKKDRETAKGRQQKRRGIGLSAFPRRDCLCVSCQTVCYFLFFVYYVCTTVCQSLFFWPCGLTSVIFQPPNFFIFSPPPPLSAHNSDFARSQLSFSTRQDPPFFFVMIFVCCNFLIFGVFWLSKTKFLCYLSVSFTLSFSFVFCLCLVCLSLSFVYVYVFVFVSVCW